MIKTTARNTEKAVKATAKGTVKTTEKGIKTAQATSKAAIKTTETSVKTAQVAAKASAKTAQKAAQAAKVTAKATAEATKATVRATIAAVKAIIAGTKALISALIAGGWIAVVIILIVVLLGCAVSLFGGGSGSNAYTPVSAEVEAYEPLIQKYAKQYGIPEYVELIKAVMMQESGGRGLDPMQAAEGSFNTRYPHEPNGIKDPEYSIECGVQELKAALISAEVENPIDMEHIKLALQGYNFGNGYISWAKTNYGGYSYANAVEFSTMQAARLGWDSYGDTQYPAHVLRYYPYGRAFTSGGNQAIVEVALTQLGNEGGQPYWSWYGFSSRVEWCCCFVSWCANECGYIESGTIPKYSVVDDGVVWFKNKDQWLDGSEEPEPGMIIFFDWADDGLDGGGDHTGIVEKVEGGTVYTIEGNSGDKVCENQYSIGNKEILGYGFYSDNNTVATGDTAQQVWTYLKSYGYSDSVAAGIIGNMMRECGGDTLNLDWNIVGHYNGDEFYGLCQWCLRYTPTGFKGSNVKEQCEYLQKTIKSEFANYGGNYNGITYNEFLKSNTRTAAIAFERVYERCGDYSFEDSRRADNAEKAYNRFHK